MKTYQLFNLFCYDYIRITSDGTTKYHTYIYIMKKNILYNVNMYKLYWIDYFIVTVGFI